MAQLDTVVFHDHLRALLQSWKSHPEEWSDASVISLLYGSLEEENPYKKCRVLHTWLMGYELSDTLLFFTKEKLYVLCSSKKIKILEPAVTAENRATEIELIEFKRSDKEKLSADLAKLVALVPEGEKVGSFLKEEHTGNFAAAYKEAFEPLEKVDVSKSFSNLLVIKDSKELRSISRSVYITSAVLLKHLVAKLEVIIDEEKQMSHSALAEEIEEIVLQQPEKINDRLKGEPLEVSYSPIIQSGGDYNLKPSAISNTENIHFGTIVCVLGVRYRGYCASVGRTFLVDPVPEQQENYEILLAVHAACVAAMKVGEPLSGVYDAAVALIKERKASLLDNFVPNCGFGMGLEFRERQLLLNGKNSSKFQEGMVFNLSVGFQDLVVADDKVTDEKRKNYSLLIADTCIIGKEVAEAKTTNKKAFSDVAYFLEDEKPDVTELKTDKKVFEKMAVHNARRERVDTSKEEDEARRAQHQKELEERQLEAKKKFYSSGAADTSKPIEPSRTKNLASYTDPTDYPTVPSTDMISVDTERETVLLPIYGMLVPFHINTIKNVTKDGDRLRVNFLYPSTAANIAKLNHQADKDKGEAVFIRELTFHIPKASRLNSCVSAITHLKQAVKQREQLKDRQASVKKQKKLQLLTGGQAPKLARVFIRPNISGRKTVGNLEGHKNGIRFNPLKGQAPVDILYDNVRNCFFQPADNSSLLVLLHFHLMDEIMVGKKRALDIQFCIEVTELSTSLTQAKNRNFGDRDEIHEEEMEREKRRKLNSDFKRFVKKVESVAQHELEFDIPYKELGFHGVPFKSFALVQPTVNCLVQLTEQPFFVLCLKDIEICCLERVNAQVNLRQFDAKFVLKDYTKAVVGIDNIPVERLDTLKEWLDSCEIKFYQHAKSLQWNSVMKAVLADPKGFFDMGGWKAVLGEDSDGEQEVELEEDPDDDEFEMDEDESEDFDEDDDSLEMESGSEVSEDDLDEDMEEEDEGEDWDQLEQKLEREDMKKSKKRKAKGRGFDSDDE